MTRRLIGALLGSLTIIISSLQAEMMYGPAIVGTSTGGAEVQVFADNGNGIFDPGLDELIQTVSADSQGQFSVSDLDITSSYFLASGIHLSD